MASASTSILYEEISASNFPVKKLHMDSSTLYVTPVSNEIFLQIGGAVVNGEESFSVVYPFVLSTYSYSLRTGVLRLSYRMFDHETGGGIATMIFNGSVSNTGNSFNQTTVNITTLTSVLPTAFTIVDSTTEEPYTGSVSIPVKLFWYENPFDLTITASV